MADTFVRGKLSGASNPDLNAEDGACARPDGPFGGRSKRQNLLAIRVPELKRMAVSTVRKKQASRAGVAAGASHTGASTNGRHLPTVAIWAFEFALVVIEIYLSVLARVHLLSSTPVRRQSRARLSGINSRHRPRRRRRTIHDAPSQERFAARNSSACERVSAK
jgi:hypothetical protein